MESDNDINSHYNNVCDSFDSMNLKENLLRGIFAYGFEKPSAIQQRAIIPSIEGRNVIAQAQSGTGKTATFSIAILQQICTNDPRCQALVLVPTRELAKQIQMVICELFIIITVIFVFQLNDEFTTHQYTVLSYCCTTWHY
ncbi:unnamed protein product [Schistosoma mattheei]|uniref:ATP-dependent RNA helicase n=1 Tax=Schistosoma mattheei TaxID=31246 RepID=A0A183Q5U2_9TREM|nr:unnamed protein product [Schistosoma mattheei]